MTQKKSRTTKYKGVVIKEFKVRGITYKIGDTYDAKTKKSLQQLINDKRIK
jgi:hypothetical protein